MQNRLLCVHTLCMSYEIKTFLLVSSFVSSYQLLCFVRGQGQKREQKHSTKNFLEFHNHSPLIHYDSILFVYIHIDVPNLSRIPGYLPTLSNKDIITFV